MQLAAAYRIEPGLVVSGRPLDVQSKPAYRAHTMHRSTWPQNRIWDAMWHPGIPI
jgi:hypothetical protein